MYLAHGKMVLGTVADGDCGADVMVQMLGKESDYESRCEVRRELSRYLLDHCNDAAFQEALDHCEYQPGDKSTAVADVALNLAEVTASAPCSDLVEAAGVAPWSEEVLRAIAWASGFVSASHETLQVLYAFALFY